MDSGNSRKRASAAPDSGRGARKSRPGRGRGRGRGFATTAQRSHISDQASSVGSQDATPIITPYQSGTSTPVSSSAPRAATGTVAGYLSEHKFANLKGTIDPRLLSAIPFENMSHVQAATLPTALENKDVLAQAKTGTGKTMAFLIPAIQNLCSMPRPPLASAVSVLILSPTRELAIQIEKEAEILLANLQGAFGVQHVVGGTNINAERKRLMSNRKDILIATPGRLLDHLNNVDGFSLDLKAACQQLRVLVLDEADRMLDMGFRNELEKIMKMLPDPVESDRQSLFFSATIPSFVHKVAKLRPDHAFISTLTEEDVNTHKHVPQDSLVCTPEQILPRALQIVKAEAERHPETHKVLVFCTTARATALAAAIFTAIQGRKNSPYVPMGPISEIHSRKSQAARTNTMTKFHADKNGILFSSDVTARGVDIPGVTLVIQLGVPSSLDQYVHRLGRTARAGKGGHGVLILADFERFFVDLTEVKRLNISDLNTQEMEKEAKISLEQAQSDVDNTMLRVDTQARAQAYQAHIGFYKTSIKQMKFTLDDLIANSNAYAKDVLLWPPPVDRAWLPPPLLQKTISMMGLKGKKGLHVVTEKIGKNYGDTGRGVNGGGAKRDKEGNLVVGGGPPKFRRQPKQ